MTKRKRATIILGVAVAFLGTSLILVAVSVAEIDRKIELIEDRADTIEVSEDTFLTMAYGDSGLAEEFGVGPEDLGLVRSGLTTCISIEVSHLVYSKTIWFELTENSLTPSGVC